jgi:hypothetical protein
MVFVMTTEKINLFKVFSASAFYAAFRLIKGKRAIQPGWAVRKTTAGKYM